MYEYFTIFSTNIIQQVSVISNETQGNGEYTRLEEIVS
jgi:hypothetical protein